MTTTILERRQRLLALEPRLRACAAEMTADPTAALALATETLRLAADVDLDGAEGDAWAFRLMRQTFHSVERNREFRRVRSAQVTGLAETRRLAVAARDAAAAAPAGTPEG